MKTTATILIERDGDEDIQVTVTGEATVGSEPRHEGGSRLPYPDDGPECEVMRATIACDSEAFRKGDPIDLTLDEIESAQEALLSEAA